MYSATFDKKTANTRRNRIDRFILPRDYINETRRRLRHTGCESEDPLDLNNSINKHVKQKKYANYLDKALGVGHHESINLHKQWNQLWPCVPRKKSYLSSADNILDLPTYSYASFPELLDWSKDNVMVAALGRGYHKWSWNSQKLVSQGNTVNEVQCCKFDPRGELLLLGTNMWSVEIHNNARNKQEAIAYCHEQQLLSADETDIHYCSITAVDWSPTGNSFAMGCSWGSIISLTRSAKFISYHRIVREAVFLVRVSPDARYVAVIAVNSDVVLLLTWPSLKKVHNLGANWTIKTLAWHPWRSALLCVGAQTAGSQAHIAVWNAPNTEVKAKTLTTKPFGVDAMLFSERTGELVVSLWNYERAILHPKVCSQLVVLSNPETAVDQWNQQDMSMDRVRTMVFNPDGTKLATATSGEELIIWNFLPEDETREAREKKTKSRRFSALPVYLDEAMQGYSIR